jgi:hypothetical protein
VLDLGTGPIFFIVFARYDFHLRSAPGRFFPSCDFYARQLNFSLSVFLPRFPDADPVSGFLARRFPSLEGFAPALGSEERHQARGSYVSHVAQLGIPLSVHRNSSRSAGQLFSLNDSSCHVSLWAAQVLPFPDLDSCAHPGCAPVSFSAAAARLGVFSTQHFSSRRYLLLLGFRLGVGLLLNSRCQEPSFSHLCTSIILEVPHVVSVACLIFSLDLQQVLETGIVLESDDRRLKFSRFSSYSCGGFSQPSIAPTECSMKCV